jgi:hypothetical protein
MAVDQSFSQTHISLLHYEPTPYNTCAVPVYALTVILQALCPQLVQAGTTVAVVAVTVMMTIMMNALLSALSTTTLATATAVAVAMR